MPKLVIIRFRHALRDVDLEFWAKTWNFIARDSVRTLKFYAAPVKRQPCQEKIRRSIIV